MVILPIPKKTVFLLGGLLIILTIVTFLSLRRPPPPPLPTPSPTPVIPRSDPGIIEKQETLRQNQYPLIDFTPYQTSEFGITYTGPLRLKITLWGKNKIAAKEAALSWIKGKGVDPTSHQITWEEEFQP